VAQAAAALLEMGQGAILGTRHEAAVRRAVDQIGTARQHLQHLPGVVFPVGGHVQNAACPQLAGQKFDKTGLDNTALVMALLGPGIRKKQQHPIECGIGQAGLQHQDGICADDPDVAEFTPLELERASRPKEAPAPGTTPELRAGWHPPEGSIGPCQPTSPPRTLSA